MYERIVVALDGSPLAEQILPHARALAEKFDASLILVRAITPVERLAAWTEPSATGVSLDPQLLEETIESEEEAASTYLASVASSLNADGFEKVQTEVPQESPVDAILECAARVDADLIAMTTHGRGGLGRLVFGSVAEGVLHKASCPTLVARAK